MDEVTRLRVVSACEILSKGHSRNKYITKDDAIDIFDCYADTRSHWEKKIEDPYEAIKLMSKTIVELASNTVSKPRYKRMEEKYLQMARNHDDVVETNKRLKKNIKELEREILWLSTKTNTGGQHF